MASVVSKPLEVPVLSRGRRISWTAFILIAGCIFNLAFVAAMAFAGPEPFVGVFDDSLMLTRYADNVRKYGAMIWNPGAPSAYGLTSPYYFFCVVLPVRAFLASSPLAVAVWASTISGALFLCGIPVLVWRAAKTLAAPRPGVYRHLILAAVFLSIAWSAPDFVGHLLSGMDACFGLLYFVIYLCFAAWYSSRRTLLAGVFTGLVGGLAFGARPDLLIYALLLPAGLSLFARGFQERRSAFAMLATSVVAVVGQVALANAYLHSPLPLSFYAKTLHLYPGLGGYRLTSLYSLCFFVASYWLLFALIALDIMRDFNAWRRETSRFDQTLLAALAVHMTYVLFGVIPIMGQHQRFYYADLPALIYLAAKATYHLLDGIFDELAAASAKLRPIYGYFACVAAFFIPLPTVTSVPPITNLLRGNVASFDMLKEYRAYERPYWLALDRFSALPDDFKMAATEIGHPAAMNLNKQVVDLSGLNETQFAHHRFSAEVFFRQYRPDLIFMPHVGYRGMNQELESNPVFQQRYLWLPPETTGNVGTGLALLKDSKYFPEMYRIVKETCVPELHCHVP